LNQNEVVPDTLSRRFYITPSSVLALNNDNTGRVPYVIVEDKHWLALLTYQSPLPEFFQQFPTFRMNRPQAS
jgi:hypothetical protein